MDRRGRTRGWVLALAAFGGSLLCLVSACGSAGSRPGSEPGDDRPALVVPAPSLAGPEARAAAGPTRLPGGLETLPLSVVTAPVSLPLGAVEERLDRLLPEKVERDWHRIEDSKGQRVDVTYQVRREKPDLSWSGGSLLARLPVSYHARFKAQVKNPLPLGPKWVRLTEGTDWGTAAEPQRVVLGARTRLQVSGDWRLTSSTSMDRVAFPPPPPGQICIEKGIRICVGKNTVAPLINRQIEKELKPHLQKISREIDRRLQEQVRLRAQVDKLWSVLQCPLQLSGAAPRPLCECKGEQGSFLQLRPEALFLGEITGDGRAMRVTVGASGRPRVVNGTCPAPDKRPLPDRAPVPKGSGFELVVESEMGFDELSGILDKNLKGRKFPPQGEQQVVIEQAALIGSQVDNGEHLLVIRLRLGGITRSLVYVRGRLSYQAKKREVRLSELDYTVETEDLFVAALDAINHDDFRRRLAEQARWDLGKQLKKAKKRLRRLLEGKKKGSLLLRVGIDSLQPLDYAVTDKGVVFRVAARGTLQVDYKP